MLQQIGARGIYHIAGSTMSRLNLVRQVCLAMGAEEKWIRSIGLEDLQEPFLRPKRTDLNCQKVKKETGIEIKDLRSSIQSFARQYT
jgi:dTDP-4-dehydrorhamnose reductase